MNRVVFTNEGLPSIEPDQRETSVTSDDFSERIIGTEEDGKQSFQKLSLNSSTNDRRPSRPRSELQEKHYRRFTESSQEEDVGFIDRKRWYRLIFQPRDPYKKKEREEISPREETKPSFFPPNVQRLEENVEKAILTLQKYIRRYLARQSRFNQLKMFKRRKMIINEIVQTEKDYCHHLEVMNQVFVQPLKEHIGTNATTQITQDEYDLIFGSGISVITNVHKILLQKLEETAFPRNAEKGFRMVKVRESEGKLLNYDARIGHVMEAIAPYYKMHRMYFAHYKKAMNCWKNIKRRGRGEILGDIIRSMESDDRTHKLGMIAYLILPVGRMPRYRMLLRDLWKYTHPEHPDHKELELAIERIVESCEVLDNAIRQAENGEMLEKWKGMCLNPADLEDCYDYDFVVSSRSTLDEKDVVSEKFVSGVEPATITGKYLFLFSDSIMVSEYIKKVHVRGYNFRFQYMIRLEDLDGFFLCKDEPFKFAMYGNAYYPRRKGEEEEEEEGEEGEEEEESKKKKRKVKVYTQELFKCCDKKGGKKHEKMKFNNFIRKLYESVNGRRSKLGLPLWREGHVGGGHGMEKLDGKDMKERKEYLVEETMGFDPTICISLKLSQTLIICVFRSLLV